MLENLLIAIAKHKMRTGLSQAKIGLQAGIIESRLCNIVKGKVSATPEEKAALSQVLGIEAEILFDESRQLTAAAR